MEFLDKINKDFRLDSYPKEGTLLFDLPENEWQRWGKNRQRYRFKGRQFQRNGKMYSIGTFMDMVNGTKKTYKSWDDKELSIKEFEQIKRSETKILSKEIKSFEEEFHFLEKANENHPYILNKKISIYGDIREDKDHYLCIPSYSLEDDSIVGIHKISTTGRKRFYKGSSKGYFSLGEVTPKIFICEGYSTACTIHAMTNSHTIMIFGQLGLNSKEIVELFSKKFNKHQIILCLDNLKLSELEKLKLDGNQGYIEKVNKAYRNLLNVHCIRPVVEVDDPEKPLSDFNDLFMHSPEKCRSQLTKLPEAVYLLPLGALGKTTMIYSSYSVRIHEVEKSDKYTQLLYIAPESYWRSKFPYVRENKIVDELIGISAGKRYDFRKMRQAGIYNVNNKIVINSGSIIYGNPEKNKNYIPIGRYPALKEYDMPEDFLFELKSIIFPEMNFENVNDIYTTFGFGLLANVSTILPMRFNMDFCGESGVGKSTYWEQILRIFMSPFQMIREITSQDTPATIKDDFKENKMVVVLRENESDMTKDRKWLFDLARESSNELVYTTKFRGKTKEHIPCAIMILSLFNAQGYRTKADENRTLKINFKQLKAGKNFESVLFLLSPEKLKALSLALTFKMIRNWERFNKLYQKNFDSFKPHFNTHKARIYAQIVSCFEVTNFLNHKEIQEYILYIKNNDDVKEDDWKESDIILHNIASMKIPSTTGKESRTIRWIIDNLNYVDTETHSVKEYVVKLATEYKIKFVAGQKGRLFMAIWRYCDQVTNKLRVAGQNRFVHGWYSVLKNELGTYGRYDFDGRLYQCVNLELSYFLSKHKHAMVYASIKNLKEDKRLKTLGKR